MIPYRHQLQMYVMFTTAFLCCRKRSYARRRKRIVLDVNIVTVLFWKKYFAAALAFHSPLPCTSTCIAASCGIPPSFGPFVMGEGEFLTILPCCVIEAYLCFVCLFVVILFSFRLTSCVSTVLNELPWQQRGWPRRPVVPTQLSRLPSSELPPTLSLRPSSFRSGRSTRSA